MTGPAPEKPTADQEQPWSSRTTWLPDVVAGLTVALLVIPQAMAYSVLAGLPPHYGLLAAGVPSLVASFFTGSATLQTGPTALTSLLTFGTLSTLAAPQSADYIALAALLALIVGAIRLGIGLARRGGISRIMSPPVVQGFASAAGLLIFSSQVPAALGTLPSEQGVMARAWASVLAPSSWHPEAIGIALATIFLIFAGRRIHRTFPGVLVAAVLASIYSVVSNYPPSLIVGEVPKAALALNLDLPWSMAPTLLIAGLVIALVGFAEVVVVSETVKTDPSQTWDPNREFISQGTANLAAAFVSAFPVGGSFSRSTLSGLAGAQTPRAGMVTGGAVLVFLPFAGILATLPQAVLGAIVIAAILSLLDPRPIHRLWKTRRSDGIVAVATFVFTLFSTPHVERGVIFGVALATCVRWSTKRKDDQETRA